MGQSHDVKWFTIGLMLLGAVLVVFDSHALPGQHAIGVATVSVLTYCIYR